jgi:hypothetical protein
LIAVSPEVGESGPWVAVDFDVADAVESRCPLFEAVGLWGRIGSMGTAGIIDLEGLCRVGVCGTLVGVTADDGVVG